MVVEGLKKMSVINHIHYLQYLNTHHPGFVLHPETIKAIENVYYCVNHNLPVNRIVNPCCYVRNYMKWCRSISKLKSGSLKKPNNGWFMKRRFTILMKTRKFNTFNGTRSWCTNKKVKAVYFFLYLAPEFVKL